MDSTGTALRSVVDRRETSSVGRHARLELVFGRRAGRTVLTHSYAEPPFRVGRWFPDGDGVHMILASSAPGIFGGDRFEQTICVEPGARVRLTSQSAMQVHPSPDGSLARLRGRYQVDEDAELTCEWDPMIPFVLARFDQCVSVRLASNARLIWSDAFMAGRACANLAARDAGAGPGNGERWAFAELSHELGVTRTDSLEYLERYRIVPGGRSVDDEWIAGASTHIGTVLASGWSLEQPGVAALHSELSRWPSVRAASDRLSESLALVRLMAASGESFRRARCHAVSALRAAALRTGN